MPLPEHVLAVDPGGTVGFATLHGRPLVANMKAWMVKLGPWPKDADPPMDPALQVVKDFCSTYPNGVVVIERFHSAQRQNRYSHFTIALIGAVDAVAFCYEMPVYLVLNRQRKDFVPKAEKILGVAHNPNHDRDDVAALGHLLAFIAHHKDDR